MGTEDNSERLYGAYYMEVYSLILTLVKDAQLAEELAQETFFRAMKSTCRGDAKESTWLCAIAKNLCMDEFRRRKRTEPLCEELPDEECLEKRVEDRQTTLRIHQVLHGLKEPYKEVFQLRVFGELSFREIGDIFERTENWARVTYHRARLKIQERM